MAVLELLNSSNTAAEYLIEQIIKSCDIIRGDNLYADSCLEG